MPLRNMLYDVLGYLKEYQEISRNYKKQEGIKSSTEEFLSGMRKEDKFHPIITIVIYYNEKEWDGPHSLFDMMIELPPEMKDVFSNYKTNFIEEAKEGKETVNMCTALKNLRRQGVKEGKIEGKIEISKVLIKRGLSIDEISDITGLTIEEIKGLATCKE